MSLGRNIKKYREKAGLSREKLAQKCENKFSANHLWRVEDGSVKNPGIEMVKAIADGLKISIAKLFQ
ncbi:MAG: helix-turn-helix transcriptional regulator [bacterium]